VIPLADTITPALSSSFCYLFALNAIIGILEAKLLKKWFGGGRRAVWWMILANYLSAWTGWFALIWFVDPHSHALLGPRPIERVNQLALTMVLVAFVVSVIIEAGFVYLATRRERRSPGLTLLASFTVNLASYAIVCLMFLLVSFTLPLNAKVVPLPSLGKPCDGTLYWIDPTGAVMSRRLAQEQAGKKVGQVTLNDFVQPCQLHINIDEAANAEQAQITVRYSFTQYLGRPSPQTEPSPPDNGIVIQDVGSSAAFPTDYWSQNSILRKSVLDLRPQQSRGTRIEFDWYRDYLDADVPGGPHSHLCIALGTENWQICSPTVLPDGKVVFEWNGQIVVFDPQTTKLAFVALGTCPAFVPSRPAIQHRESDLAR
jgi:hypothetical protein